MAAVCGKLINRESTQLRQVAKLALYDGRPSRGLFPTDFLFFRAGGDGRIELSGNRYRLVDDLYYSDHHALIAWLKVRGGFVRTAWPVRRAICACWSYL